MHRRTLVPLLGLSLCACVPPPSEPHDHDRGHSHAGGEHHGAHRETLARTVWTADLELFVEFPLLVVGNESPFAIHMTWLDGFRPVRSGKVTVVLSGGAAAEERFVADSMTSPGIFGPVVKPIRGTERELTIILESGDHRSEHKLGTFAVVPHAPATAPSDPEDHGSIQFLKEQQWKVDFSTEVVATHPLRPSFTAYGTLVPRADGELLVSAPATGRLVPAQSALPIVGSSVHSGDVLARLVPRLDGAKDVASLDLDVASARLDLTHAVRERERIEGLLPSGAIPERRATEVRHAEATARATLKAARRRWSQYKRVQSPGRRGAQGVDVRTPLSGTVLEVRAVAGAFVEDGTPLFRVVDPKTLWLSSRVPEIDLAKIATIDGAWFQIPGTEGPRVELDHEALITRSGLIDPTTRTVEVIFSVPNETGLLRVGASVETHLTTGERIDALCVSSPAVLLDAGLEYVFVQTEGETFERRQVKTGIHDGGRVQIIEGVVEGEHVVGKGAYAVKLTSATTAPPGHGHAH